MGYELSHGDQSTRVEPHLFLIELGTVLDSCVEACHLFLQRKLLEDPQSKSLILIGDVYVSKQRKT
jgi:hypothetical protein